jgi:hypothetical protein
LTATYCTTDQHLNHTRTLASCVFQNFITQTIDVSRRTTITSPLAQTCYVSAHPAFALCTGAYQLREHLQTLTSRLSVEPSLIHDSKEPEVTHTQFQNSRKPIPHYARLATCNCIRFCSPQHGDKSSKYRLPFQLHTTHQQHQRLKMSSRIHQDYRRLHAERLRPKHAVQLRMCQRLIRNWRAG